MCLKINHITCYDPGNVFLESRLWADLTFPFLRGWTWKLNKRYLGTSNDGHSLGNLDTITLQLTMGLPDISRWILLLLLLMIWQSPGLPGWRKVNFITVTRRPHHPNIAAGLYCLATSPGFLPTLCEKWSGFFYVHRVFLSYTRDRRLKVSSERLGNEDKAPCPRALLPGRGSNRGPPVWKSQALTAQPRQLLNVKMCRFSVNLLWRMLAFNLLITHECQ